MISLNIYRLRLGVPNGLHHGALVWPAHDICRRKWLFLLNGRVVTTRRIIERTPWDILLIPRLLSVGRALVRLWWHLVVFIIIRLRRHLAQQLLLLCLNSQHHSRSILLLGCCCRILAATFLVELITLSHEKASSLRTHFFPRRHARLSNLTIHLPRVLFLYWQISANAKGNLADCLIWRFNHWVICSTIADG